MHCPLCETEAPQHWHQRQGRDYWRCQQCFLVFVAQQHQLEIEAEKAIYDQHQNCPDDPGYRRFLQGAHDVVVQRMAAGTPGLDFGCGPGPALAAMLERSGYPTALYDLFYQPNTAVLEGHYGFITLTEVIEHLSAPRQVLAQLWRQLDRGGLLVIQTQRVLDQAAFSRWRYIHDPTHIAFYSVETFDWLARWFGASLDFPTRDLAVLTRV